MTALWQKARRFAAAPFVIFAALGGAACATPIDDGQPGQPQANGDETVDTPPVTSGSGAHQANGFGSGGSSGAGGSNAGGSSGGGGSSGAGTGGSSGGGSIEPGLAASFSFEDTDNKTVSDGSGNANNGTFDGSGISFGEAGKVGKAVSFSGLDGRIVIPPSPDLEFSTAATIEFWVKLNGTTGGTILSHVSNAGDGVRVRTADGNIQVFFIRAGIGSASVVSDSGALGSSWTHVAIVNDGSSLKLYLNGKMARSGSGGQMAIVGSELVIGRSSSSDNALNGSLDELNWWTVARSQSDICEDAGGQWSTSYCLL